MRGEAVRPVLGQDRIDALLAVGIGRTAERKRDRAQAQLEQPVAPRRLQIIMPFRRRPADQLDLSVVEPEPLICCARLRLDRAVVGEEDALRAAFDDGGRDAAAGDRSEEHTSELQSLMRISYAVFCLKKKKTTTHT